ncbi:MAG: 3-phosphoserine/phosphohydroxythreonine transaminase [Myxococcota bacterium]|nr:3-phosphoserine/phosphohydroxythreonine transaminase [Myxococcota bacterium]
MATRRYNFNAGPAALPLSVLQTVRDNLVDFEGHGLSLLEMSHRSPEFGLVIDGAKTALTELYQVPDTHEIMFMQGGASLQFAMVPLNLGPGGAYIDTGTWSSRAIAEAHLQGDAHVLWTGKEGGYSHIPTDLEIGSIPPEVPFVHYTSNNTIYGTQFASPPKSEAPLVCDMSSDFISRPINIAPYDLIYAGAQKNAGPSGVTVLIIRRSVSRTFTGHHTVPKIMRYLTQAEKGSMYNTPNTFGIWLIKLVAEWVLEQGGLGKIAETNAAKAQRLYDAIEAHPLCACHADATSRSLMNVTFRMQTPAQEQAFLARAAERNIIGLKGHRSVGGLRASLYNAIPSEAVDALIDLLNDFRG